VRSQPGGCAAPRQARCGVQGSFNDLQLLLVLNLTIVTVGGLIKHYVVDPAANAKNLTLDQDWYRARPPLTVLLSRNKRAHVHP
jgi:hypothetical protein